MKKFVLIALCVLMLIGTVSAENYGITWEGGGATCGAALTWSVEGSTLYITGTGEMYDFPSGAPWAAYRNSITQVVLSGGVTTVGAYAFQDYDSLLSVDFGTSLISVGKDAFSGCDGLTAITLPATFKKFGENSFRSCKNLKQINCSGGFPRFDENCLWDTYTTIVYSASNPWSVSLVEQLENAFQGRIEFRSSDGTDPYVPTQPTTAPTVQPTQPQWNTPTESPTQETFWATQLPTTPVYTEPVVTQPVTVPVYTEPATVPTLPVQTLPQNTQPTIVLGAQATTPPTYSQNQATDGNSIFGVLIVVIILAMLATGALLVKTASSGKKKGRKGKYNR